MHRLLLATAFFAATFAVPTGNGATPRQCPANETWNACGSLCEPRCGEPALKPCILRCDPPSCVCRPGFFRNSAGSCVREDDCHQEVDPCDGHSCPAGQICIPQTVMCIRAPCNPIPSCVRKPTLTCANVRCGFGTICVMKPVTCKRAPCDPQPVCERQTQPPTQGCHTVKCSAGHTCVMQPIACAVDPCPERPICVVSPDSCSRNETWSECGTCDEKCGQPNMVCPAVCREAACQCKLGFKRHADGRCVLESDCGCATEIRVREQRAQPPTCELLDCHPGSHCIMAERPIGGGSYPSCVPNGITTCASTTCAFGQECFMQEVRCFVPPCHPVPTCRQANSNQNPLLTCATLDCRQGYRCVDEPVQCLIAPCPTRARCIPDAASGSGNGRAY